MRYVPLIVISYDRRMWVRIHPSTRSVSYYVCVLFCLKLNHWLVVCIKNASENAVISKLSLKNISNILRSRIVPRLVHKWQPLHWSTRKYQCILVKKVLDYLQIPHFQRHQSSPPQSQNWSIKYIQECDTMRMRNIWRERDVKGILQESLAAKQLGGM